MNQTLIKEILEGLLTRLNLPFDSISMSEGDGFQRIDIVSSIPSKLIGWHGETLNSVQHLLKAIVRSKDGAEASPFLVLDVDGYRRDQEEKVRKAAERKAEFVRKTGNRVALQPMSPYFRRVVHLHVASHPDLQDLTTMSTGQGDYRQVVLQLKEGVAVTGGRPDGEELSPVMAAPSEDDDLGNLDV
jgi:spoIIIJ-associated protein